MSTLEQGRTAPRNRTWALFGESVQTETREVAREAILDARRFEEELYRQRARADRSDSGFVLLSFSVGRGNGNGRTARAYPALLAEVVRDRARLSDVVGWDGYAALRVGAILPCADPEALHGFVADVESTFQTRAGRNGDSALELLCDIFAYPSSSPLDGASR